MDDFNVLIIGSGPSGAHAASEALIHSENVGLISIGFRPDNSLDIPKKSFTELRKNDKDQKKYFLGRNFDTSIDLQSKAGTHLTPPREFMILDSGKIFPVDQSEFHGLFSTGRGGLGISWGANCFTYDLNELSRVGIQLGEIHEHYIKVAEEIGVSGDKASQTKDLFYNIDILQPPLKLDSNCQNVLEGYLSKSKKFRNFKMGQSFVSILSTAMGKRSENKLLDMDFWSNDDDSTWRPHLLINSLKSNPNFHEIEGFNVLSFQEEKDFVVVTGISIGGNIKKVWKTKKLFICCGALNSARLVANSLKVFSKNFHFLCNKNIWMASINLKMLGKKTNDSRYSLSQLTGCLVEDGNNVPVVSHFYSYRSLLLYRLASKVPLPSYISVFFLRLILNSLTLINIQFEDAAGSSERSFLVNEENKMIFKYSSIKKSEKYYSALESSIKLCLMRMLCVPLFTDRPKDGASIHYAGTLNHKSAPHKAKVDHDGRLESHRRVYIADSSHWGFLPAKGLTFTLMADARRIVKKAFNSSDK